MRTRRRVQTVSPRLPDPSLKSTKGEASFALFTMAKKGKKEKKQDAAAAEDAAPQESPAEPPQNPAPVKQEIEPSTPPTPQEAPPSQEDPPAPQDDAQSEEAPAKGATPSEEDIEGDASAPTPGARETVPVSTIPKAPPGSCAVCRGRSNVGALPFPQESCRERAQLQTTLPRPTPSIGLRFPSPACWLHALQGYLAHKNPPPRRTLP